MNTSSMSPVHFRKSHLLLHTGDWFALNVGNQSTHIYWRLINTKSVKRLKMNALSLRSGNIGLFELLILVFF